MSRIFYLILFTFAIVAQPIHAQESNNEDNLHDGLYVALSLSKGLMDGNLIDRNLVPREGMKHFTHLGLNLRYQKYGFFIELPGRSQQEMQGQFSGNAIGYNFMNTDHWTFEALIMNSSKKAQYQVSNGTETVIFERENDVRAGLRATGYFDNFSGQLTVLPYSFKDEIGGVQASLSGRYEWQFKNLTVYAAAGLLYRSEAIIDHLYGLTASDVDLMREYLPDTQAWRDYVQPYEGRQDLTYSGEFGLEYPLSESWVIGGYFNAYQPSDSITDSPVIVKGSVKKSFALTATYVF